MKKKIKSFIIMAVLGVLVSNAQLLYKVEGKGLEAPSYIFGSHHLSPISIVEESGAMEYFNKTRQVVGELDLTIDPMALSIKLQPFMMAPADSTLSVLLQGEDIEILNAQFEKWSPMPGMKLSMLEPLKPLAVTTMLVGSISKEVMPGYDPENQLDAFFMQTGAKEGKKVIGLETPEYQGEVLFNMTPLSVQAKALIDMLKNPEKSIEEARKLSKAYQERDLDALFAMSKEDEEYPEFMEHILYDRNANWMKILPAIIKDDSSFIVVGALHLAGPQGILQQLKEEGFEITPIY